MAEGTWVEPKTIPTVAEAVEHWLADRRGKVKATTLAGYAAVCKTIAGPLLDGTKQERADFAQNGKKPRGARFIHLLGPLKLDQLSTAAIRTWHRTITEACGVYTANRAKSHLRSILALAEEDYGVRAPSMPTGLSRARQKVRKAILSTADIRTIIEAAKADLEHGIYYGFPFLAGTRPSEQLGLLWDDVDFAKGVIHIRRIQERDGSTTDMTKTAAGTREVPMGATLREMLLAWRVRCPRLDGQLHRVFPGPGRLQPWPKPRLGGGTALLYQNFRRRYWEPPFKRLGPALRHAALRSPQLHLDAAGPGHRGRPRRQDRRPCQSDGHARPLHAGGPRRRSGHAGFGAGLCGILIEATSSSSWGFRRSTDRRPRDGG